jgi:hypothetical protein
VELRPYRAIRYSPRVLADRGLSELIAPPSDPASVSAARAPENIALITARTPQAAAETLRSWLAAGILLRERRPGLWIYRQTLPGEQRPRIVSMLIGLVRLPPSVPAAETPPAPDSTLADRLARLKALRADFEPFRIRTRAPLAGALSTTRLPDLSAEDVGGVRHDAFRVTDYAQHVELQGLVKNVEVSPLDPPGPWEAARAFAADPDAAKLSGARYKLCAIVDEVFLERGLPPPPVASGFFAFSLEDPVY